MFFSSKKKDTVVLIRTSFVIHESPGISFGKVCRSDTEKPQVSCSASGKRSPEKTGVTKLPILGDQTMQIYGKFKGFPLNNALFGLVFSYDPWKSFWLFC